MREVQLAAIVQEDSPFWSSRIKLLPPLFPSGSPCRNSFPSSSLGRDGRSLGPFPMISCVPFWKQERCGWNGWRWRRSQRRCFLRAAFGGKRRGRAQSFGCAAFRCHCFGPAGGAPIFVAEEVFAQAGDRVEPVRTVCALRIQARLKQFLAQAEKEFQGLKRGKFFRLDFSKFGQDGMVFRTKKGQKFYLGRNALLSF